MHMKDTRGQASIIVPSWNQPEFTRHCIAALKRHTRAAVGTDRHPHGSTDYTDVYPAGVQDAASVLVTVISAIIDQSRVPGRAARSPVQLWRICGQ